MARAADNYKSCDTADRTGNCHGTDDDFLYMDTCISGGIFTLTDYSDLITLFAVFQVDEHTDCQDQDDQHIPSIFLSKELWQPSCLCCLIDDTDCIGSFWIFPENNAVGNDLHRNVVQHQCEQCLIGIPVCLEYCRDHSPDHAANGTCNKHYDQKQNR